MLMPIFLERRTKLIPKHDFFAEMLRVFYPLQIFLHLGLNQLCTTTYENPYFLELFTP